MAKNTIKIKNYSNVFEEFTGGGTITPGMLVEITSSNTVRAHSVQEGDSSQYFAIEDELQGNGISDNYSSGNQVQVWVPGRGDQVYALLAAGENASIGSYLTSNGDGNLKVYSASSGTWEYPKSIVAEAVEAVNNSAGSSAARIEVRII